jgi:hypothetical protein
MEAGVTATRAPAPAKLRTLGIWLVVTLIFAVFADLVAVAADADQRDVFDRLLGGEDVSYEEVSDSDDRTAIAGGLQGLAFGVNAIVWIAWFRRAYINIPRISDCDLRYRAGWAIGAWFVPILNLFRPKQMINDVWRASDPAGQRGMPCHESPVAAVLHWWWAAWLVSGWVANAAGRLLFQSETVADQRRAANYLFWSDLLAIFVDLFAIYIVWTVTRRYEARRKQVLSPVLIRAGDDQAAAASTP